MARDPHRDEEYFLEQIDFTNKVIQRDLPNIESFPRLEGRALMASSVRRNCIENLILRYSRGDSIQSMHPALMQWVQAKEIENRVLKSLPSELANIRAMYQKVTLDTVYDALTVMAFGTAVHLNAAEMSQLIAAITPAGEDALIDEAARALGDTERPVAAACKYPKVYALLLDVWRSPPEQRPAKLLVFADQWKRKIKPIYWSNSLEGAEGAYFGYWCFDIALTVIVLKIPDEALRANPYYPADLVDVARRGR